MLPEPPQDAGAPADRLRAWLGALGFRPRRVDLYLQALTHPSFAHEAGDLAGSNQRLEFLGDAVLQIAISDLLFRRLPAADEGALTRARAAIVCESSLARAGREIGLGDHLRLGRGEEATGGRDRPSVLADAMEALLGAAYLDQGLRRAQALARRWLGREIGGAAGDPKSALQERVQAARLGEIDYRVTGAEGPAHARTFSVQVWVGGEVAGAGEGRSKKLAERAAAASALQELRRRGRIQ